MVKERVKKCSKASKKQEKCLKLFGFKIQVPVGGDKSATSSLDMRKSRSVPDLITSGPDHGNDGEGYQSDGPQARTKKKGIPWTEKEHRSFLSGLEKLGKGNWKGISRKYVRSRTATQVASHAQKYFKRLSLSDKKNRRSSLFDMSPNEPEIKGPQPPQPTHNAVQQAINYPKASGTPLTAPSVLPFGVPNLSQMTYIPMVGMGGNGSLASMPTIPMMYNPNPAYFYFPKIPNALVSNTLLMPTFSYRSTPMARP